MSSISNTKQETVARSEMKCVKKERREGEQGMIIFVIVWDKFSLCADPMCRDQGTNREAGALF